jgi:hypothetical protein
MVTQEEGVCAYRWFLNKWRDLLPKLQIYQQKQGIHRAGDKGHANTDPALEDWRIRGEWKAAVDLQRYLIAMLMFLRGGQRLQIYAELLNADLMCNEEG